MSTQYGTIISAPIRQRDSLDQIPVCYVNEASGGFHVVSDISGRDAIFSALRIEGMLCYVLLENLTYQLQGGITNNDWVLFTTLPISDDGLVWLPPVIDKDLATPPGSPSEGDRYLIAPANNWYDPAWLYRRILTTDAAKVGTDESGAVLTVEINGMDDIWAHAQTDGDDIFFCDFDGNTRLRHDLEIYDPVAQRMVARVRVPNLDGDVAYSIYLYYGMSSCTSQAQHTATYPDTYGLFYDGHVDAAGLLTDRTNYGRNTIAALVGSPTLDTDNYGLHYYLDGNDAWRMTNIAYWEQTWSIRTHTAIVKSPAEWSAINNRRYTILAEGGSITSHGCLLYFRCQGTSQTAKLYARWWVYNIGTATLWHDTLISDRVAPGIDASGLVSADTMFVITMVYNAPSGEYQLFVNGVEMDGDDEHLATLAMPAHSGNGGIGYSGTTAKSYDNGAASGQYFIGDIYEIFAHNEVWDINRHITLYNNRLDNANFWSIGAELGHAGATDAWAGHDDDIAERTDGDWVYTEPAEGYTTWVKDELRHYTYSEDIAAWHPLTGIYSHEVLTNIMGGTYGPPSEHYHMTYLQWLAATRDATNTENGLMPAGKLEHWDLAYIWRLEGVDTDSGAATPEDARFKILGGTGASTAGADDTVTINTVWDRTDTTLSPVTAGDDIQTTGMVALGANGVVDNALFLDAQNTTLNTTATTKGINVAITKTDGITTYEDSLYGVYNSVTINDADTEMGSVYGQFNMTLLTDGTLGNAGHTAHLVGTSSRVGVYDKVYGDVHSHSVIMALSNTASVEGNAIGELIYVDIDNALPFTGNTFGLWIQGDIKRFLDYGFYVAGAMLNVSVPDLQLGDEGNAAVLYISDGDADATYASIGALAQSVLIDFPASGETYSLTIDGTGYIISNLILQTHDVDTNRVKALLYDNLEVGVSGTNTWDIMSAVNNGITNDFGWGVHANGQVVTTAGAIFNLKNSGSEICDIQIKSEQDDWLFRTDSIKNRVGIGQETPTYKLNVKAATTGFGNIVFYGVGLDDISASGENTSGIDYWFKVLVIIEGNPDTVQCFYSIVGATGPWISMGTGTCDSGYTDTIHGDIFSFSFLAATGHTLDDYWIVGFFGVKGIFMCEDSVDTDRFHIDTDGTVKINNAYTFPTVDGGAGTYLGTDGVGEVTFTKPADSYALCVGDPSDVTITNKMSIIIQYPMCVPATGNAIYVGVYISQWTPDGGNIDTITFTLYVDGVAKDEWTTSAGVAGSYGGAVSEAVTAGQYVDVRGQVTTLVGTLDTIQVQSAVIYVQAT